MPAAREHGEDEDAIAAAIARALGRPAPSLRRFGRGTDHTTYEIDEVLVARVDHDRDGAAERIEREARLLERVAAVSPVPVPTVVAIDLDCGLSIATKLRGTSLLDEPTPAPERVGAQLAALLAALWSIPPDELETVVEREDDPPQAWLDEATRLHPAFAALLDGTQRHAVERFLAEPAPAPPPASVHRLCHNDLGAEHLLAASDRITLTGVIDWSDAALTDPAIDLGRIARDLGPQVAADIAGRLDQPEAIVVRASFYARCALLEDLRFGVSTGDSRYRDAALANFDRTFHWSLS